MLQVTIENERQRDQLVHASGILYFGRQSHDKSESVVIDDVYVSRDQFELEELPDGKVRLLGRGGSSILLDDGESLAEGDERHLALPLHIVVGGTTIDIESAHEDARPREIQRTLETSSFPDLKELSVANIADYYPFPLAFGFRMSGGITNSAELYKEQLRLAENLLAFIASLSLALLAENQFAALNEKAQGSALSYWQGGISPGDWMTLAIHAADQLVRSDCGPLARGLVNLQLNKGNKGLGKIMHSLIRAKNDFKHDRGPSIESEYQQAADETAEALLEAYQFISFLVEHPIRLVQDVNPRRRGRDFDVLFLKCMGDHPGFMSEESVRDQNLRKGDLYVETDSDRLTPLFPFIHATPCEQCKSREFFFIDRLNSKRLESGGVATLKSFDRGHAIEDCAVGEELIRIFQAT